MHDTDDDTDPRKTEEGREGDIDGDNTPPAQKIPDELPGVRIGEIRDDTKNIPERPKDLRERLPDTGLDPDDTIGDLPLIRRNPDTQIDEPPSGDDAEEKTNNRGL